MKSLVCSPADSIGPVSVGDSERRRARNAVASPVEGDAFFSEHLGNKAVGLAEQGEQKMFVLDFAVAKTIGRLDGIDEPMPEAGRAEGLREFLLVQPFVGIVTGGGADVILVRPRSEQVQDFLAEPFDLDTALGKNAGGYVLTLAEDAEEQVFSADVFVAELARFVDGKLDGLPSVGALGHLRLVQFLIAGLDQLVCVVTKGFQIDVEILEDQRGDAGAHGQNAEQEMDGCKIIVV